MSVYDNSLLADSSFLTPAAGRGGCRDQRVWWSSVAGVSCRAAVRRRRATPHGATISSLEYIRSRSSDQCDPI